MALKINTFILGDLATNCYLIWDDKTLHAALIDPADGGDFLSEEILRNNLTLQKIILTHGHFDHVLGLLEVKLNFPQAPIFLHQADQFLIKEAAANAKHWLKRSVDPVPPPDQELIPGAKITIADQAFEIIHTPGHTPGSVGFYSQKNQLLFSGDTLFKSAVGRTDFRYSNANELKNSLKTLLKLPAKTVVLSGHGEATTIEAEKAILELEPFS